MKTIFHIQNGKITNPSVVRKAFELPDGSYEFEPRNMKRRSLPQNAFFHSILPELQQGLREAGWREIKTVGDAKWFIKKMFLKVEIRNEETGEVDYYVRKTSSLNKEEMRDFIDEVIQWAAEYLGITIFSPNEQSAFDYMYGE